MATVQIRDETSIFSKFITGPPNSNSKDRTRFYACELKSFGWTCKKSEELTWKPQADSLATQVVPIASWSPVFLDQLVLAHKLKKPVSITN